ncbi:MAG: sulfatase-like hydrolase/transferase, partial [Planctomycetota bacterium]
LKDFHVAPMCTPTRSQLMTGVHAMRNGATCVSAGRSLVRPEFKMMPEFLKQQGYATGLFGKWHLGDQAFFRPSDRGFDHVVRFESSYIGSLADHFANDYFDPHLIRNGRRFQARGYNTDVFFDEAMDWMKSKADDGQRFFCYLPTAAPHWPHFAPRTYREQVRRYWEASKAALPNLTPEQKPELFCYLAMILNVDDNIGRLETFLQSHSLTESTLLIFLSDNGSTFAPMYFDAGMRGKKQSLFEGGHRVPCFIRWPGGGIGGGRTVEALTRVEDLLPTILDLLGIETSAQSMDGISLAGSLRGKADPPDDRMIPINYARMSFFKEPYTTTPTIPHRDGGAVLWKRWRWLAHRGQLYDLKQDPKQLVDLASQYPKVAEKMRRFYDRWWSEVSSDAQEVQPIVISPDTSTRLTAQDWADVSVDQHLQLRRGVPESGSWYVNVAQAGRYVFKARRWPQESGLAITDAAPAVKLVDGLHPAGRSLPIESAQLQVGNQTFVVPVNPGDAAVSFVVDLQAGPTTWTATFHDSSKRKLCGVFYAECRRANPSDGPA